jgi:hypothetical protein
VAIFVLTLPFGGVAQELPSFLSFFAFKEGMWDTQIAALLSSPTVIHEPGLSTADENSPAIFKRVSPG